MIASAAAAAIPDPLAADKTGVIESLQLSCRLDEDLEIDSTCRISLKGKRESHEIEIMTAMGSSRARLLVVMNPIDL